MINYWKQKKKGKDAGFTLVELMIVMMIIVILVGISVNGIIVQQQKSRDARRKADLEIIRGALEQYRTADPSGSYPAQPAGFLVEELDSDLGTYLDRELPEDPQSPGKRYMISISGGSYALGAALEYNPPLTACLDQTCDVIGNKQCTYCVNEP